MAEKHELSLSQKLALLPASIPDCILDFLEDFNFPRPLEMCPPAIASVKPEYLVSTGNEMKIILGKFRELGEIKQVEARPLHRQYPGSFLVKLLFDRGVRGFGCIVSQGTATTGLISVVVFDLGGYSEDMLKDKLVAFYKR